MSRWPRSAYERQLTEERRRQIAEAPRRTVIRDGREFTLVELPSDHDPTPTSEPGIKMHRTTTQVFHASTFRRVA